MHTRNQKPAYQLITCLIFALFLVISSLFTSMVHGQSIDATNVYDLSDQSAQDGDILSFTSGKGLERSSNTYDIHIFGVLQDSPALVLKNAGQTGRPVARSGIAEVNVTNLNGDIKAGDYITSSQITGYGMKATESGYSVGIATQDFDKSSSRTVNFQGKSYQTGKVAVAIRVEFAELTNPRDTNVLFESIGTAFFRNTQDPKGFAQIIKYTLAAVVVILSLISGMVILARTMPKAIEAMGRNPLARTGIQFSIILNIGLVVFIVAVGIIASLIIIKF